MSIDRKHTNARMSQIVIDAGLVYLAGQVSTPDAGESVAEQSADILERIDGYLAEAGSDKTRLISATIWLSDVGTFAEFNSIWDKWVPKNCAPARACVETRFPIPHVKVEVMIIARQLSAD